MGLIGTHWSRGWIIEDNTIQYSKCSGIALGKYGDEHDNNQTESAQGYVGTIKRALAFGWNKGTIGGHFVRNNTIAYCEQTGIVGSMGCAFSIIEGNIIHDIHTKRLFTGAEMAGIKFHGAVDVEIKDNQIYRTDKGVWLDWMAQGTQVKNNLMYENDLDIFLEVNHGPTLIANNLLLSKFSLLMNTKGAALVHNIFGGAFNVVGYDARLTPYLKPHATSIEGLHDNQGGDIQVVNNLFVMQGNATQYDKALLPVNMRGNVYTKGTNQGSPSNYYKWTGLNDSLKTISYNKEVSGELNKQDFDAAAKIIKENGKVYLEINLDKNWLIEQPRKLVTTKSLHPALIPKLPFENTDGSMLQIDNDYFGHKRNSANPSPGAFEIKQSGRQKIKVW
jgi:alpha-N-arabinofuranosidase